MEAFLAPEYLRQAGRRLVVSERLIGSAHSARATHGGVSPGQLATLAIEPVFASLLGCFLAGDGADALMCQLGADKVRAVLWAAGATALSGVLEGWGRASGRRRDFLAEPVAAAAAVGRARLQEDAQSGW